MIYLGIKQVNYGRINLNYLILKDKKIKMSSDVSLLTPIDIGKKKREKVRSVELYRVFFYSKLY